MSMSSFTEPIIAFSSSMRRRRISSCKDRMTVSVLDLKPRSRWASSISGAGISRVVRILQRVFCMLWGVKNEVL